jgi:uncharacterized protein (TIGR03067 family)
MKTLFGLLALVIGTGAVSARDDDKDELKKLEGTYLIVGMERGGEKMPAGTLEKAPKEARTITIKGNKMSMARGKSEESITLKIDASKTPHEITTTETKPNGKSETMYGIYKLKGDTLTICGIDSEKPSERPKEFKTAKGSNAMIMILKKEK